MILDDINFQEVREEEIVPKSIVNFQKVLFIFQFIGAVVTMVFILLLLISILVNSSFDFWIFLLLLSIGLGAYFLLIASYKSIKKCFKDKLLIVEMSHLLKRLINFWIAFVIYNFFLFVILLLFIE